MFFLTVIALSENFVQDSLGIDRKPAEHAMYLPVSEEQPKLGRHLRFPRPTVH